MISSVNFPTLSLAHNGKYGYINKEGKTLIKPSISNSLSFFRRKAVVVSKGIYQIIDLNNKVLYTFESVSLQIVIFLKEC